MSICVFVVQLHSTCKFNYLPVTEYWGMIFKDKVISDERRKEGLLFNPIKRKFLNPTKPVLMWYGIVPLARSAVSPVCCF